MLVLMLTSIKQGRSRHRLLSIIRIGKKWIGEDRHRNSDGRLCSSVLQSRYQDQKQEKRLLVSFDYILT